MNFSNLGAEIAAGADRLKRMMGALAGVDREIDRVQREQGRADAQERFALSHQLRELQAERRAGSALVEEAERQLALRQSDHHAAVEATLGNMHKIGSDVDAAARRFDKALKEAEAALVDLEQAARPLERTVLARDLQHYFGWTVIMAAIREAFEDRLPGSHRGMEARTMELAARLVMRSAGENAARIRVDLKEKELVQ